MAARAQTIVSQTFTSTGNRVDLPGTSPTVNLPGGTWIKTAGFSWSTPFISATWDPPGLAANIATPAENPAGVAISLSSSGGYVKPASFTISSTMMMFNSTVTDANGALALGFYSSPPPADTGSGVLNSFTGIKVYQSGTTSGNGDANPGRLELFVNGAAVGPGLDLPGTLLLNAFYTLSYTVNTATGALSNLTFDGNSYSFSTTGFTDAATAYGMFASDGGTGGRGAMANFSVVAVPEPSTWAMLTGGFVLLALCRRYSAGKVRPGVP